MCGRYTIAHSTEEILERFDVLSELMAKDSGPFTANSIEPNYNVAPTNVVPIIRTRKNDDDQSYRVLENVKWGLIPFWVKDLRATKPLINARAESLLEKPFFKKLFARHRCIIPADGFYEWMKEGKIKTPMRIGLAGQKLFGLAGIWDDWRTPEGEVIRTCSIITTVNNELLRPVHNRMPVILPPDLEALWLNPEVQDPALLAHILAPYPDDLMQMYPVSKLVNSVANNSSILIQPLPQSDAPDGVATETGSEQRDIEDQPVKQLKLL